MDDLTAADGFELESADKNDRDKTDDYSINRWSKKGDRLYLDDDSKLDKHNVYVDLETATVEGAPSSTWSTDVTVEGDTLTVTVERGKVRTKTTTFVVRIEAEEFGVDDLDDGEPEDEPEVATDGGENVTEHVSDETIAARIEQHDDPDHPDATTVEEVRALLAHLQTAVDEGWAEYMDQIEDGTIEVVAETDDLLVLDTGEHKMCDEEIGRTYSDDVDGPAMAVLDGVMHDLARQHSDHNWGATYPLVVRKPEGFGAGQRYVEAVMLSLMRRGLSPGQAWAYYGVEIRGNSRNSWASRCGYSDHSAVSEPLRKAHDKVV